MLYQGSLSRGQLHVRATNSLPDYSDVTLPARFVMLSVMWILKGKNLHLESHQYSGILSGQQFGLSFVNSSESGKAQTGLLLP